MKLIEPSLAFEVSYRGYINELGDEERYPFPLDFDDSDFPALLARLRDYASGSNLPAGVVPSSTYWLVDGCELIGVTNIRHRLNKAIEHCGGHLGLSIRPAYRGCGVGHDLMRRSIQLLQARGVKDIHIHCYAANPRSAATIQASGGILHSTIRLHGKTIQRFRVNGDD